MSKKKRRKKREAAKKTEATTKRVDGARKWRLRITSCEIAREHDEIFRAKADPAFIVALVGLTGIGAPLLLERALVHADVGAVPGVATLTAPAELKGRLRGERLAMLVFGMEVDGGSDVAKLYTCVEDLGRFRLWIDADIPAPHSVVELGLSLPSGVPNHVKLLVDDVDFAESCRDDDYIAAVATAFDPVRGGHALRFRTSSADGKNDWTLVAELELT